MTLAVDRRSLLRGRIGRAAGEIRPPFSRDEKTFSGLCDGCGACVEACPEKAIAPGADGRPLLRYRDALCTFCQACGEACPTGAIDSEHGQSWTAKASIGSACLSFNGIVCRACGEHCDDDAIRFKLLAGGRALPLVDETACTGCLKCALVCPTGVIRMRRSPQKEIAA
ncbi:MAG: ferredoxin-type protein NapF [Hyphomicrobiales bacterium]|nr:ferredoxin-type protein NapF [Hyphomicrobiales bacterium]